MLARIRKAMDEKDQGFTLIELLVVMIIIGILAAIAIPTFLNQRNKGYDTQAKSDLRSVQTEMETFYTDAQAYPTAIVVGSPASPAAAGTIYVKKSASVGTPTLKSGLGTEAYCVQAASKSGTTWHVSSTESGVVTGAC
ncbi:prepilin-type N-terminal cleavage/methylation domain-containing protein [Kineococcus sp. T13]|uniref:type IV pilin protein n=1 Tax=Kineococcus vitellinus TaxID=2696565 RepID=UPI001411E668|nr:prepilin-type N-terminal cleavage/methylation domain-containing protein [Kineococcus vitellinus]NAZ74891.1 prepilin-type N-terminal cleavage/methylation domain-containing protein [Kineococcus vitellinus]